MMRTSRKGKQLIYGHGVTLALGLFLTQTQWEADELAVTLYPIISFPQDDPRDPSHSSQEC